MRKKSTAHTFIISRIVFKTMRVIMKYSKGVDSTILQSRYLKPTLSSGIYRSNGVALMAKSIQDFCNIRETVMRKANMAMLKRLKYFVPESIAKRRKKILVQCQICLCLWQINLVKSFYIAACIKIVLFFFSQIGITV